MKIISNGWSRIAAPDLALGIRLNGVDHLNNGFSVLKRRLFHQFLPGEQIVGAICTEQTPLMLFSERGLVARIDCSGLRYNQRGDLGSMAVQVDAESDRLVGISAGTGLVGVRTSKDRHGRLDPEDFNISNPGEKLMEQTLSLIHI